MSITDRYRKGVYGTNVPTAPITDAPISNQSYITDKYRKIDKPQPSQRNKSVFEKTLGVLSIPESLSARGIMNLANIPETPGVQPSFADIRKHYIPDRPGQGTWETVGKSALDITGGVAIDPTTYMGGAAVKGILKAAKAAPVIGKAVTAATRIPGEAIAKVGSGISKVVSRTKVGQYFTKATGHTAYDELAKKSAQETKYLVARSEDAANNLERDIVKTARKKGVDPTIFKRDIREYVEKGSRGSIKGIIDPDVARIGDVITAKNVSILQAEKKIGTKALDDTVDYLTHVTTGKGKSFLKKLVGETSDDFKKWTPKHRFQIERTIKGKSVEDINQWARARGMKGDAFRTNPAEILAIRERAGIEALQKEKLLTDVKQFGVSAKSIDRGTYIRNQIKNGLNPADADISYMNYINKIGPVGRVIKGEGEKALKGLKGLEGMVFPKEIADAINKTIRVNKKGKYNAVNKWFEKYFDPLNSILKQTTLSIFPSYHLRNIAGNIWNNFLADVRNPARYGQAAMIQRGADIPIATRSMGRVSSREIMQQAERLGVTKGGIFAAETTKKGPRIPGVVQGMQVGTAIEDNARVAHFLDRLVKGDSYEQAAKSVKKFLFDYGRDSMSDFEKDVLNRVIFFYSWPRNNIPLQLEMLIKRPGKFAQAGRLKREVEEKTEKPNEAFMTESTSAGIPVRIGKDSKGNTRYKILEGWWPAVDLNIALEPWRWKDRLLSMVNPIFKEPLVLALNQDPYFKTPIERFPGETKRTFMGVPLREKYIHALRSIRFLKELDNLNPGAIFGSQEKAGIGGYGRTYPQPDLTTKLFNLLWGKVQTYDEEYEKIRMIRDKESELREAQSQIGLQEGRIEGYSEDTGIDNPELKKKHEQRFVEPLKQKVAKIGGELEAIGEAPLTPKRPTAARISITDKYRRKR